MTASFNVFQLQPFLMQALADINFKKPTKVQEKLIPVISAGRSVIGQSATGSGKTHTFLLPMLNNLNPDERRVQAVITTPSRELAYQIQEAAKQLIQHSPKALHIGLYVGGTDKQDQIDKLNRHQPQLVIGTPGRILDLIRSQALNIHTAQQLVVDEADMTLDLGFLNVIDQIAGRMPADLQMLVFSATMPQKLTPFLKKYMNNPVMEEIPVESVISPTIDNWLISTKSHDKNSVIYKLLTIGEPYLVLIFANTKERVQEIARYLKGQGMTVAMIHGDIKPRERKRVMRDVQNLKYQFVVATDLASRGIDIEGVSHVINDDIPNDLEFFIHRVGRTGRNGMPGTAITLYSPGEEDKVSAVEAMGIKFKPKAIRDGEIVDSYDRNRREKRGARHDKLDPSLISYVKNAKKKVKPGYKRRIRTKISDKARMDRRIEQRAAARKARKDRKG
ncbi:DEAD/DEAH box helicase [Lactiplantibacillus nangangensis]|uniref:DEAD-box ATP-dependent RNA helicase CshB n=1 Tax=Lactiplantibacillus nangangensis TaxID=2559917 RepID=A0ABW1SJM6_9LACO|nr:DEAD/DEAH box helicase [Lactiplantibacillus nangangensis]